MNLPADSEGIEGWFHGKEEMGDDCEPISLCAKEDLSTFKIDHLSACMVFDLSIDLFNASNIAYKYHSKKKGWVDVCHDWMKANKYELAFETMNELNHTSLLVLCSNERILITFKGTTSLENMKTDLKISFVNAKDALPTNRNLVINH